MFPIFWRYLVLAIILLFSQLGYADAETTPTTARVLFELCNSAQGSEARLICDVYMAGFAQGISTVLSTINSHEVCLPDYFNGDDARAIFNRYAKSADKNPSMINRPANIFLWSVIATEFPCKK